MISALIKVIIRVTLERYLSLLNPFTFTSEVSRLPPMSCSALCRLVLGGLRASRASGVYHHTYPDKGYLFLLLGFRGLRLKVQRLKPKPETLSSKKP